MDFSKDYKLKMTIDNFKKETGLNDEEVKDLFLKTYFIKGDDENNIKNMWEEFLKK